MATYNDKTPLVPAEINATIVNYEFSDVGHPEKAKSHEEVPFKDSPLRDSELRVVGPLRLASILFFLAYGGSYGVEGVIATAPPFYVLLAFLVAPFVWAIPEALITAELSSAIPCVGGNIVWANAAFGHFLAWQSGFWALVAVPSAVSMYPTMFLNSFENVTGIYCDFWQKLLFHLAIVLFIVCVNIRGTKTVSGGNMIFSLLVLGPFVVLIAYGFAKKVVTPELIMYKHWTGHIAFSKLATNAIWSCGGWTNAGQLAGEIANPRKSFSIATTLVFFLTLMFSLLPLAVAMGVDPNQQAWEKFKVGYWVVVAHSLGGVWFKWFMGIGAMIGALGEMNSSFCSQARMLYYLSSSDDFMFPRIFSPMSRFNTPYIAVFTLGVISFVISLVNFQYIMDFVVLLSSLSLLISFACLMKLRITKPDMQRPFSIPGGIFGLIYVSIVGVGICIFNIVVASYFAQIGGAVLAIIGILVYFIIVTIKKKYL